MSIRTRLALIFTLLIVAGVTSVSSIAILVIRNRLLEEGAEEMRRDARRVALSVGNLRADGHLSPLLRQLHDVTGYELITYDTAGQALMAAPTGAYRPLPDSIVASFRATQTRPLLLNHPDSARILAYAPVANPQSAASYVRLAQRKDVTFGVIAEIRWIIYYGMFISIGLVVLVSAFVARSISRPIRQLTHIARAIADGDVNRQLSLKRRDEFGILAQSLNEMADRLRRENLKLLQMNKRQRQFYADITHEIRNPLHTLMGALEMLELPDLPPEQREQYVRLVRRQAERMNRLFRDLMTLQRSDSDEQFVQPKAFDLSRVTQNLTETYAAAAEREGLTLTIATHAQPVYADPAKLEQVLDNLLSNALKYTNEGEVRLAYAQKAGEVVVSVTDTGIGIDEAHLPHLFDRFYRTDQARSRTEGGTGLGLAVVKRILQAHGTDIEVSSTPGAGTTFRFRLPPPPPPGGAGSRGERQ